MAQRDEQQVKGAKYLQLAEVKLGNNEGKSW